MKNKVVQIKTKEELKALENILMTSIVRMACKGTLTGFIQDSLNKQNEKRKKPNPFKVRHPKISFPDTMILIQGLNNSKPMYYIEGILKFSILPCDVGDFVNYMIADGHHIHIRPYK
jgi:hypothetical protein